MKHIFILVLSFFFILVFPSQDAHAKQDNKFGINVVQYYSEKGNTNINEWRSHLEMAKVLTGEGHIKLFFPWIGEPDAPLDNYRTVLSESYLRNLTPIVRIQGGWVHHGRNDPLSGCWKKPTKDGDGSYRTYAQTIAQTINTFPLPTNGDPLYIEVWNEMNYDYIEWCDNSGNGQYEPEEYAKFYLETYNQIQSLGKGQIKVMNGGLGRGSPAPYLDRMANELKRLTGNNLGGLFENFAVHVYPDTGSDQAFDATSRSYENELEVLSSKGIYPNNIIVTEGGYIRGSGGNEDARQAASNVRLMRTLLSDSRIKSINFYTLDDYTDRTVFPNFSSPLDTTLYVLPGSSIDGQGYPTHKRPVYDAMRNLMLETRGSNQPDSCSSIGGTCANADGLTGNGQICSAHQSSYGGCSGEYQYCYTSCTQIPTGSCPDECYSSDLRTNVGRNSAGQCGSSYSSQSNFCGAQNKGEVKSCGGQNYTCVQGSTYYWQPGVIINATGYTISEDFNFVQNSQSPQVSTTFPTTLDFTLSGGEGVKTVFVKFFYSNGTTKLVQTQVRYQVQQQQQPQGNKNIPKPVVVMDGFDINPTVGHQSFGAEIYNQTRSAINVAIGDLEPQVQSGQLTRAQANALVAQFRAEGKLYLERVQVTKQGNIDPNVVVDYWSSHLDHYDGIMINEYSDDITRDGQSQNAIEALRRIREKYPNKVIMPAFVMALGWSGRPSPYFGGEVRSYSQFLQAARDYTDLIFYEFYITSGNEGEFVYFDSTRQALDSAAPGILSKTFYGLYVPQTVENIGDSYGTDTNPARSFVGFMSRQLQKVREWNDIAGVGFWVYYRQTPHVAKTVSNLAQSCYRNGNCSYETNNIFANPSFESGFAPWSSSGAVQVVSYSNHQVCTEGAVYNPNLNWCSYMKFGSQATLVVGSSGAAQVRQSVNLEPGQTYYLKVFAKTRNGDARPTIRVQYANGEVSKTLEAAPTDRWKAREVWFTAQASSATIVIESSCGGDFYIDSIKLEKTVYSENNLMSSSQASCGAQPNPTPQPSPVTPTPNPNTQACPGGTNACGDSNYGQLGNCSGSWAYASNSSRDAWCQANAGNVKAYCYTCNQPAPLPTPTGILQDPIDGPLTCRLDVLSSSNLKVGEPLTVQTRFSRARASGEVMSVIWGDIVEELNLTGNLFTFSHSYASPGEYYVEVGLYSQGQNLCTNSLSERQKTIRVQATPAPTPISTPVPQTSGDVTGDGQLNIFDYALIIENFGTTNSQTDIDRNGVVDIFDYAIFLESWLARAN